MKKKPIDEIKEEWKDIDGYENSHQVSNFGNTRSLDRVVGDSRWGYQNRVGKVLSIKVGNNGYRTVKLSKNGSSARVGVHRLVAMAFMPNETNKPYVDHIDGDKSNNHIDNLRWVTARENTTFYQTQQKTSSEYTGVCWDKSKRKWVSCIRFNSKRYHIARFYDEYEAHLAYQDVLKNGIEAIKKYRRIK